MLKTRSTSMPVPGPVTAASWPRHAVVAPPANPGAWTLRAWPPLLWQAGQPMRERFRHLHTGVASGAPLPWPAGRTVWAASAGSGEAGVAWDWVQLTHGVVAMADPLAVVTNLRLVDDSGEELSPRETACFLAELVRELPWQHEVQRALGATPGQLS
jgi:hypothetical protein